MQHNLAILASGQGTLSEAFIAAPLPISLVLADRPCRATDVVATAASIDTLMIPRTYGPDFDRVAYTEEVLRALKLRDIAIVAMAGFMTILSPAIFEHFGDRITNSHPSLLPKFKGAHAVSDALAAGVKETGFTIHVATPKLDDGPILKQVRVPVLPGDDVDTLHERIKEQERIHYPQVIKQLMGL